jgi:hypothetical protein
MEKPRPWLVIAHPGHELRVFHWLELYRPHVLIWTNGSGNTGLSRLDSTRRLINATGATLEEHFGNFPDIDVYRWILEKKTDHFLLFAKFLLEAWATQPPALVVGDSIEGYNTSHDLCRYVVNAASEAHFHRIGRKFSNLDFLLAGKPDAPETTTSGGIRLVLDEAAVERN